MKTAVILFNGDLTDVSLLKKYASKDSMIICADGGANLAAKFHLTPHVIIGDMDSISPTAKKYFSSSLFLTYPKEKNFTDSELAIEYALKEKCEKILIFGLFGRRLDHMLANIFHIASLSHQAVITIVEGTEEIIVINKTTTLQGKIGDELSLLPFQKDVKGITTLGLQYPLNDEALSFGSTRGISNIFAEDIATIEIKEGSLLAFHKKN